MKHVVYHQSEFNTITLYDYHHEHLRYNRRNILKPFIKVASLCVQHEMGILMKEVTSGSSDVFVFRIPEMLFYS